MPAKPSGRPPGPLIPCGWCHEPMTTSQLRVHLANCPARPKNVWAGAPQLPLEKWTDDALKEAYEYLNRNKIGTAGRSDAQTSKPKPYTDTLTCGDEEEL